ncbi:hypothetical protein CLOM_g9833, partial [Closterium sp. NIES-68]
LQQLCHCHLCHTHGRTVQHSSPHFPFLCHPWRFLQQDQLPCWHLHVVAFLHSPSAIGSKGSTSRAW